MDTNGSTFEYEYLNLPIAFLEAKRNFHKLAIILLVVCLFLVFNGYLFYEKFSNVANPAILGVKTEINYQSILDQKIIQIQTQTQTPNTTKLIAQLKQIEQKLATNQDLSPSERLILLSNYHVS